MNPLGQDRNKTPTRKMADTYKKIRMQTLKHDQSIEEKDNIEDYE